MAVTVEGAVSCPFCGGEARITYVKDAPFAGCENKSCPAHNFDAIPLAAWNKREPLRKPPAAELCPFCGSIPDRWYVEGEDEYFARCRNPKCEAAMFPGISLEAWNKRPSESSLKVIVELWKRKAESCQDRLEAIERGEIFASRWIPMTETDPDYGQEVFILGHDGKAYTAKYRGRENNWIGLQDEFRFGYVKYWMPKPKPPEVK